MNRNDYTLKSQVLEMSFLQRHGFSKALILKHKQR